MITAFIFMGMGCFLCVCSLIAYFVSNTYTAYPELKPAPLTKGSSTILYQHYQVKTTYYQFISQCPPNVVNQMTNAFNRSKSKEKAHGLSSFAFEYRFRKSPNHHEYYVHAKFRRCELTTIWNPVGDTTFEDILVVDDFPISNETI